MASKSQATTGAAETSFDGRYFCLQSPGSFTLFYGCFRVNALTHGGNKALDLESQYESKAGSATFRGQVTCHLCMAVLILTQAILITK